jgi:hypothetical protein
MATRADSQEENVFLALHDVESASSRSRALWLLLTFVVAVASVALAAFWQTPGHSWGDDFAAYLLQAKALLHGTVAEEVQLNARLMAASDWRTGPDAYPWGYPAILAMVIAAFGSSLATVKVVSIASMAVITLTAGALAYVSRLSFAAVVCVAIMIGMQPDLTSLGDMIGSDVVFLALTGVALLFAAVALRTWSNQPSRVSVWATIIAAVFAALSYFVRSNGAVTLIAIGVSLVAVPILTRRATVRALAVGVAPFALMGTALLLAYYALLPDGTLVHVGYLTANPSSLARRTGDAIAAFGWFYPMVALPPTLERLSVLVLGALAVYGARRLGKIGFLLALYAAGHLVLVTLFPYNGGQRYYLPVLFAVAVLAAGGVEGLASWAATKLPRARDPSLVSACVIALFFVGAVAANIYRMDLNRDRSSDGPYSREASELFAYIRAQPAGIQPVAFFKPRAMRLLGGKEAVLIRQIDSTRNVNSIALFSGPAGSNWQLSERQVAALPDFRPVFRNESFTLYVRKE